MNVQTLQGKLEHVPMLEHCRHLLSVVVAIMHEDGDLIDCNAGFRRLLQCRADLGSNQVAPFFLRPGFDSLRSTLVADGQPLHLGMVDVGDSRISCHTLLGAVHRIGDCLVLVAEFDVAEMENLNAQVLQFNEQLIGMQRELARSERRLRASEAQLLELSQTDPLTGLANRRRLEQFMQEAMQRWERHGEACSLIMLDIDHFKHINDSYGHDTGDAVLCHIARLLRGAVRAIDLAARVGGEEFILLLSALALDAAVDCAERLRRQIVTQRPPGVHDDISASFGVVQYCAGDDLTSLLRQADAAMYLAKSEGRNRVQVAIRLPL